MAERGGVVNVHPDIMALRLQRSTAGSLTGTKNELIAYVDLSRLAPDALDPRSKLIMLHAMCGFANFASFGIMGLLS